MPNKDKETVTPTEETKDEKIVDIGEKGKQITEPTDNKTDVEEKGGFVKHRVERAKRQTEKELLEELGVSDLDEAKEIINSGKTALAEVRALKEDLEKQKQEALNNMKHNALVKLLDEHKVFDSEALSHYVDLDKVEFDENGVLKDADAIVNNLKQVKPNFFGTFTTESDVLKTGSQTKPKTALDRQREGDNVGAIASYLNLFEK